MANPDPGRPDLLARTEQAQAQSHTLREQVAALAEAVAQVDLDVARVHEGIAEQGGSLAAQAREHASGPGSSRQESTPRQSAGERLDGLTIVGRSKPD